MPEQYRDVVLWRSLFPALSWQDYLAVPPDVRGDAVLAEEALAEAREIWQRLHGPESGGG